jgi:hypothetical protein
MCVRNVPGISIHFLSYLSRSILSVFFYRMWSFDSFGVGHLVHCLDIIFWPA